MDRGHILRTAWKAFRAQTSTVPFRAFLSSAWRQAKAHDELEALVAAEPILTPRASAVRAELVAIERTVGDVDWAHHRALSVELFRLSITGEALAKQA